MAKPVCPYHAPLPAYADQVSGLNLFSRTARNDLFSALGKNTYGARVSNQSLFGKQVFMTHKPDHFRQLMIRYAEQLPKSRQMYRALEPLIRDGIFISSGPVWKRRRAMVEPALDMISGPRTFDLIGGAIDTMCERLAQRQGEKFNLEIEMAHTTADAIYRAIFSTPLSGEMSRKLFGAFQDYQETLPQISLKDFFGLPRWMPGGVKRKARDAAHRIRATLKGLIGARMDIAADQRPVDLLTTLIAARDNNGRGFDQDELVDEIAVLFLAGHETTASVLTWAVYLLLSNPGSEEELLNEVRAAGGRIDSYHALRGMDYTASAFQEAMRLYPPVPFITRDSLQTFDFRGWKIRKGAMVVLSPWIVHRRSELWEHADQFMPGRFTQSERGKFNRKGFIPFGLGPRACPGASFANIEGPLILATLISRFVLSVSSGPDLRPICRLTTRPSEPIYLQVEDQRREG